MFTLTSELPVNLDETSEMLSETEVTELPEEFTCQRLEAALCYFSSDDPAAFD